MHPTPRLAFVACLSLLLGAAALAAPRLGLQTWTCRNMTFEEAVVFAAKLGIKDIEVFHRHLDPAASKEENLKKLALLRKHGVTAYSIGVSATSMDKEANRQLFELAKLFNMGLIIVEPTNPAEWDNLEELVKEYDIKLAIHNHGTGTVYGNPATIKEVLAKRDRRIGVCLDVGWVTAAGFDAAAIFRNYGDRVYDIHLKDKRLDQLDEHGRPLDTMIGLGNSNYAELFDAIKETGWSGVMSIETDSAAFAENPTEFVTRAKAFFDAHVSAP